MWELNALFLGAFLAATILPFSSEIMMITALSALPDHKNLVIAVATAGNVGGAILNWGLGRYVLRAVGQRWFPFSEKQIQNAQSRFQRYGSPCLIFSWVPVIGDPLTFIAGMMRVPLWVFFPLVLIGKMGRYAVLAYLM